MDKKERNRYIFCLIICFCLLICVFLTGQRMVKNKKIYQEATKMFRLQEFDKAKELFASLGNYKDSASQMDIAERNLIDKQNEKNYNEAIRLYEEENFTSAIEYFNEAIEYKDSKEYINKCQSSLEMEEKYLEACKLYEEEKYEESVEAFEIIKDYKDSIIYLDNSKQKLALITSYNEAMQLYKSMVYNKAYNQFSLLGDYKDSKAYAEICHLASLKEDVDVKILEILKNAPYGKLLDEWCTFVGNSNYEKEGASIEENIYTEFYNFGIYYIDGIKGEIKIDLECDYDNYNNISKIGILSAVDWSCSDENASYEIYNRLKEYISIVEGLPKESYEDPPVEKWTATWAEIELSYVKFLDCIWVYKIDSKK